MKAGLLDLKFWKCLVKNDIDAVFKILLGSIILLIPGFNLAVLGYGQRCLFNSLRARHRLPAWHNCRELLAEGAAALGIAVIYLSLPLLIGFILRPLLGVGKLLGWILAGLSSLLIPLAWANWKASNEWKSAFLLLEIWNHLCCCASSYFILISGMIAVIALGLVLLFSLPILGILGAVLIFSYNIFFFFQI